MDGGIVQIIVALIGLIGTSTPVILEFIKQRATSSSETEELPTSILDDNLPYQGIISKGHQKRNLMDLSIILLYGTLFSSILAHSLLVSGRIPTLSLEILIQILFITIFTTATLTPKKV